MESENLQSLLQLAKSAAIWVIQHPILNVLLILISSICGKLGMDFISGDEIQQAQQATLLASLFALGLLVSIDAVVQIILTCCVISENRLPSVDMVWYVLKQRWFTLCLGLALKLLAILLAGNLLGLALAAPILLLLALVEPEIIFRKTRVLSAFYYSFTEVKGYFFPLLNLMVLCYFLPALIVLPYYLPLNVLMMVYRTNMVMLYRKRNPEIFLAITTSMRSQ